MILALNFSGARRDGSTAIKLDDGTPAASHFFGQSSHAQHAIVHARSAVRMPTSSVAELRDCALLGCGVLTGACTILRTLQPPVGSRVAIWGAGTVGLAAIMACKLSGCEAIAIDLAASKLALAHDLGARHPRHQLCDPRPGESGRAADRQPAHVLRRARPGGAAR